MQAQVPERLWFGSWPTTYHLGDFEQIAYSHLTTMPSFLILGITQDPSERVVVRIKSSNTVKYPAQ